ncbi:PIN domain-containing protein [Paramicrobacterium sp. CJ85]|uniref:PIN domain-containing protein n=1 Tax=Paramicrobacterium sp. CJ85 TaxID=3445355 RepID=UPI003F5D5DAD
MTDSPLMHSLTFTEVLIGPMRAGREALAIQALNDLRVNEWSPGPRSAARLAKLRVESGLKLPDCCVLDTALENDASLATFNARLSTVATEFGVHVL